MLSKDYLQIYIMETEELADTETYRRLYDCLPDFRRNKIDGIKSPEGKRESLAAFLLLMYGLHNINVPLTVSEKSAAEWNIHDRAGNEKLFGDVLGYTTGDYGKPFFSRRPDICFSLSHTAGMAMCAIAGSPVGCDIEKIKEASPDRAERSRNMAGRFFHPDEWEYLKKITDDAAFMSEFSSLWTMKESYIKYTGRGMGQGLDSFRVCEGKNGSGRYVSGENGDAYIFSPVTAEGYAGAVCSAIPPDGCRVLRLSPDGNIYN